MHSSTYLGFLALAGCAVAQPTQNEWSSWSAPTTSVGGAWNNGKNDPTSNGGAWNNGPNPTTSNGGSWGHGQPSGTCTVSTTTVYVTGGSAGHGTWSGPTGTPTGSSCPQPTQSNCLSDDDAEKIVDGFINLLENTQANFNTALANSLLADDFTDTSDSINFLAGFPLTTVTFPSKQAFIAGQGQNQPIGSVTTLNIWHSCSVISWRWRAYGVGPAANAPVTGINVMEINGDNQIETNYSEFNSGAWLLDLGNPECKSNATGSS